MPSYDQILRLMANTKFSPASGWHGSIEDATKVLNERLAAVDAADAEDELGIEWPFRPRGDGSFDIVGQASIAVAHDPSDDTWAIAVMAGLHDDGTHYSPTKENAYSLDDAIKNEISEGWYFDTETGQQACDKELEDESSYDM